MYFPLSGWYVIQNNIFLNQFKINNMCNKREIVITFRVNLDEWQKLDKLSKKWNVSNSITLRTLILKEYEIQNR